MKINHDITRTKILEICKILQGQASEADRYKEEHQKVIDNTAYTQEAKNHQLEDMRVYYISKLNEVKEKVKTALEVIRGAEAENESILELDVPEYANTIASITAYRGGMIPEESLELILKTFAGQRQLLILLTQSLNYEKGSGIDKTITKYTQDIDTALYPLTEQAENLELSPDSAKFSLYNLHNAIIEFGELHGISFTDEEKTAGFDTEDMQTQLTRAAMGL